MYSNPKHLILDPDYSIVIEACAGSGKTWLLISRIIRLLLEDVKPREILVITFSRKSIEEIKERLNTLLYKFATCDKKTLIFELKERGVKCNDIFKKIPKAKILFYQFFCDQEISIETFHSWFFQLNSDALGNSAIKKRQYLRKDASKLQIECTEDWWNTLMRPEKNKIRKAYECLLNHLTYFKIEKLLFGPNGFLSIRAEWNRLQYMAFTHSKELLDYLFEKSIWTNSKNPLLSNLSNKKQLQNLLQLKNFFQYGSKTEKKFSEAISNGLHLFKIKKESKEIADALRFAFLDSIHYKSKNNTITKELRKFLKNYVCPDRIITMLLDIRLSWSQHLIDFYFWHETKILMKITHAWFVVGQDLLKHYQFNKNKMGVWDFVDIEASISEKMLNSQISFNIQNKLKKQYRHLLIDEFQDTNFIQWQVLLSWLSAYQTEKNYQLKIFLVGDPKQTIYSFRRVDFRLFKIAKEYLCEFFQAKYFFLNVTYRNSSAIVKIINQIFQNKALPKNYPFQEERCIPNISSNTGIIGRIPLITNLNIEKKAYEMHSNNDKKHISSQKIYQEAIQVGQIILNMKYVQKINWKDIWILTHHRTHFKCIQSALNELNIPLEFGSGDGELLNTLAIKDLIALLTVLISTKNNLALAQVLRSPIYNWSNEKLSIATINIRTTYSFYLWNYIEKYEKKIYQQFKNWIELTKTLSVYELLNIIYQETNIRECYAKNSVSSHRAYQVIANLDSFLSLSLKMEITHTRNLIYFLQELDNLRKGRKEDNPDEGEIQEQHYEEKITSKITLSLDKVKIMTIHASKGLEIDHVFLMDANNKWVSHDLTGVYINWDMHSFFPKHIYPFCSSVINSPLIKKLKKEKERIEDIEKWNILYVAITRAKKSFIVSGSSSNKQYSNSFNQNTWYDIFQEINLPEIKNISFQKASSSDLEVDQKKIFIKNFKIAQISFAFRSRKSTSILKEKDKLLDQYMHKMLEYLSRYDLLNQSIFPTIQQFCTIFSLKEKTATLAYNAMKNLLKGEKAKELLRYSNPLNVWIALEIINNQKDIHLIDKVIEFSNKCILIQYKLEIPFSEKERMQKYKKKLQLSKEILSDLIKDKPICSYLLGADQKHYELI